MRLGGANTIGSAMSLGATTTRLCQRSSPVAATTVQLDGNHCGRASCASKTSGLCSSAHVTAWARELVARLLPAKFQLMSRICTLLHLGFDHPGGTERELMINKFCRVSSLVALAPSRSPRQVASLGLPTPDSSPHSCRSTKRPYCPWKATWIIGPARCRVMTKVASPADGGGVEPE